MLVLPATACHAPSPATNDPGVVGRRIEVQADLDRVPRPARSIRPSPAAVRQGALKHRCRRHRRRPCLRHRARPGLRRVMATRTIADTSSRSTRAGTLRTRGAERPAVSERTRSSAATRWPIRADTESLSDYDHAPVGSSSPRPCPRTGKTLAEGCSLPHHTGRLQDELTVRPRPGHRRGRLHPDGEPEAANLFFHAGPTSAPPWG